MFVVHIENYGDYHSYRDIVGTKAVAEERAREAGWKLATVNHMTASIKDDTGNVWQLVVETDGGWRGLGWKQIKRNGADIKPPAWPTETDIKDFDF